MSTVLTILAIAVVALLLFTRFTSGPRISGEDARAKVEAGALLIDVRSPGEFASGHIKGARNIPHTDVAKRSAELGAQSSEIVLYCASGMRSAHAARALRSSGFEAVHDLGPKSAW